MAETWNAAKADTIKTCWPELTEGYVDNSTETAFRKAEKDIIKNTGLFETKSGRLDKNGKQIQEALKNRGKAACGDIAIALWQTSYVKEFKVPTNLTAEEQENKAMADAAKKAQEKATADAKAAAEAASARAKIDAVWGVLSAATGGNFSTTRR